MPRRLAIAAVISIACERAPTRTPTVAPTPSSPRRTTEIPELFEGADGRFGYRNRAGGIALAPGYLAAYPFTNDRVAHVVDETGWACIDTSGRVLLRPFVYDNGPDYLEEGLARYVDGGKVGFADAACKVVIAAAWDFAGMFGEGRAPVCKGCAIRSKEEHAAPTGGVWGFIDKQGHEVVKLEWDFVEPFAGGRARVERGGVPRYVDEGGGLLPVATPVAVVHWDGPPTWAQTLATPVAARAESLAACGDDLLARGGDALGFVKTRALVTPSAELGHALQPIGLGDEAFMRCVGEALAGLPTPPDRGTGGGFVLRFGLPPGESEAPRGHPAGTTVVFREDGTCAWLAKRDCPAHKICASPEATRFACGAPQK